MILRTSLLFAAGLLLCAQNVLDPSWQSRTATGKITAASVDCTATSCVWIVTPPDVTGASIQLSNVWTGTVQFESSTNGSTWVPASTSSATSSGIYNFQMAGKPFLRARASALSGGTIQVDINTSTGTGGGGGGGSGTVTSVALAMPTGYTVSGSPITAAGTFTVGTSPTDAVTFPAGVQTGDGTKVGVQCFSGTTGEVCLSVANAAGTAIVYLWPSTNGATNQVLTDSGSVTCPTLPTVTPPLPATCHQMAWTTPTGGSSLVTVTVSTTTPVTVSTTGAYYFNDSAAAITFNLPTITGGMVGTRWCFTSMSGRTGAVTLHAPAATTIVKDGNSSTSGGNLASAGALGDAACVIAVSTTLYVAYAGAGTWGIS